MAFKINGSLVSETSKLSTGNVFGTGKTVNGTTVRVCYSYDIANNVPDPPPPAPPNPPIDFYWTDCDGNSQSTSLFFSQTDQVCAIVGTVTDSGGGDITNTTNRCP